MENEAIQGKQIILFQEHDVRNILLSETLQRFRTEQYVYTVKHNPEMGNRTSSVYEYFINRSEPIGLKEKDLYYVFLPMPEFWEVRAEGAIGTVYDMGVKKANVYFKQPYIKRYVHKVDWLTEEGIVFRTDFYGRFGYVYCSIYYSGKGEKQFQGYYNSIGEEIVNISYMNDVVCLFEHGQIVGMFSSLEEFETFAVSELSRTCQHITLTSIKQLNMLDTLSGTDMKLVLQKEEEVMEYLHKISNEKCFIPLIVMNNCDTNSLDLEEAKNIVRSCYAPNYKRQGTKKTEALIVTLSDRILGLEQLVDALPEILFHVAAPTQVSKKLHDLSVKENVAVHPMVREPELQNLFQRCTFYLDINFGREVSDAVIIANKNNMLIIGFEQTLHNKYYPLEEYIYKQDEVVQMILDIKDLIKNADALENSISRQQKKVDDSVKKIMG